MKMWNYTKEYKKQQFYIYHFIFINVQTLYYSKDSLILLLLVVVVVVVVVVVRS